MKEELLHYAWRAQRIDIANLQSTTNERIEIIDFGQYNRNSGPDFLNARLRINNVTWAGHVEMHLRSSDWNKHMHSQDLAYDNVILHVVLEEDAKIRMRNGRSLPCLELKNRIPATLLGNYLKLMQIRAWVPCEHQLAQVPTVKITAQVERALAERLTRKSEDLQRIHSETKHDWEDTFYRFLARSFGFKVNAQAFETLARNISWKTLQKHRNRPDQVEALLFGCAGMLNQIFTEDYPSRLMQEFHHLERKYNLRCMPGQQWRRLRLRPSNFPSIRIAQFAALLIREPRIYSQVLEAPFLDTLFPLFLVKASAYWDTHYSFDRPSPVRRKALGRSSITGILINTIAPFLFFYGQQHNSSALKESALELLSGLPAEDNRVTRRWQDAGMANNSAAQSQGLIQLKQHYCERQKCLACAIGNHLLSKPLAVKPGEKWRETANEDTRLYVHLSPDG